MGWSASVCIKPVCAIVIWSCTLLACDKAREAAPVPAKPAQTIAAPARSEAAPVQAHPTLANSELETLLARWTEAQNQGDFAAYEQLYAARFLGTKRAGDKTTQFTRETWLKDRQRMFDKPIKVEALEPVLKAASDSAELSFTQRWASGTFEDVGKKRLLVVREAGTLKIAQEEMLSSELVAASQPSATFDFHFTLALENELVMPLPEAKAPAPNGPVRAETEADPGMNGSIYTSSAPLDEAALESSVLAWKGQQVRLDSGCLAKVTSFMLLTRVEPHFGTVQEWQGTGEPPSPALSPKQTAPAAFKLTTPVVVARLEGCRTGTYARREQTAAPVPATFVEDPALVPKARAAFAKLKVVTDLQKRYLAEAQDPSGLWWEPSLNLQSFRHPISGQTLISAMADNGGFCAEFAAREWALFELKNGKLIHLYSGVPASIERVLDVNGDGRLELIVQGQTLDTDRALISPDAHGPRTELSHSYQDCPC